MKRVLLCILVFLFMVSAASAMGGSAPAKKAAYPYLIDNFEDGNYNKDPEWFTFDGIIPSIANNSGLKEGDAKVAENVGTYSLGLTGAAKDWYVGGMGVMLGIDATGYDSFNIDVYGNGENSGKLKIELYESVTGKTEIEVGKDWKPLHDNLWSNEIEVNWTGWKHLSIPIKEFKNEGHGSNVWNPKLINGQGGLVKAQLISVATTQTGSVNYDVDNIELGVSK
ncbi:MAG: hypothetical protein WC624_04520 [Candidatus Margulisiibacteriota bacterium]